ncbi:hypothetical protein UFOVP1311_30 [uncultured Caudovirales phage]|jgi:hypothetical protein|uniref:Uncharacterized protein n=1 Tax=uncultured Caudovirales phage TaxID=2100421 RepID=A0A6J5RVU0_9CAUD|nr:hypothetical protein UFOVP1311_30 [uncultured Caudovirales phage]
MNIIEAVKLLQSNNDKPIKLMRRNKNNDEIILDKVGIFLTTTCVIDGKIYKDEPFTATIILAEDWYVLKDEKLYLFAEAIDSLRKGKSIRRKAWINRFSVDANENHYNFSKEDLNANDWIIK